MTTGKLLHGVFVRVEMDADITANKEMAKKLTEVCPVDIFGLNPDGTGKIREENQDECVLHQGCSRGQGSGDQGVRR